MAADLARDAGGEAAEPGGVEARVAARLEHEDQDRPARALLGDQQVLGRDRLERDVADQVHEAVHRELMRGASVAALDALERAGLDQEQPDGPASGEAGHDAIELLIRVEREHHPPQPAHSPPLGSSDDRPGLLERRAVGRSAGRPARMLRLPESLLAPEPEARAGHGGAGGGEQQIAIGLGDVAQHAAPGLGAQLGLRHLDGDLGLRRQPARPGVDGGIQPRGGHHAVHETPALRRPGIDAIAEQDQLAGARRADLGDQAGRGAPGERKAEIHLGHVEDAPLRGDPEVAGERERHAAPHRVPMDTRQRHDLAFLDRAAGAPADLRRVAALALARAGGRRPSARSPAAARGRRRRRSSAPAPRARRPASGSRAASPGRARPALRAWRCRGRCDARGGRARRAAPRRRARSRARLRLGSRATRGRVGRARSLRGLAIARLGCAARRILVARRSGVSPRSRGDPAGRPDSIRRRRSVDSTGRRWRSSPCKLEPSPISPAACSLYLRLRQRRGERGAREPPSRACRSPACTAWRA